MNELSLPVKIAWIALGLVVVGIFLHAGDISIMLTLVWIIQFIFWLIACFFFGAAFAFGFYLGKDIYHSRMKNKRDEEQ